MTLDQIIKQGGNGFLASPTFIYLTRCPECHQENYAMAVSSGECAWCGFNANEEMQ